MKTIDDEISVIEWLLVIKEAKEIGVKKEDVLQFIQEKREDE